MSIKKHRIKKLDRRTHGFERLPKSIFKLQSGADALKGREFICYLYIFSNLTEFNPKMDVEFGTFQYSNIELAHGLGWTESKVSRAVSELKEKGYIFVNNNDLLELTGYKLLYACFSQFKKKNIDVAPYKSYIPFKEIIEYCKAHPCDFTYEEAVAKLQEIEMDIYLTELDIKENSQEPIPT